MKFVPLHSKIFHMKTFYLFMTVLVIAGVTGCKCPKKVAQQEPTAVSVEKKEKNAAVRTAQPVEATLKKDTGAERPMSRAMALPNVIIYKTKADYSKNVPIGLNEERTAIVSYPGKTDLNGQMPIPLEYGFLLDKRGINTNVAFLKYTYDEYLALEAIPPIAKLFNDVIDADPLTEMYNCGKISDFLDGNIEDLLNKKLIESGGKPEMIFKKLK